MMKLLASIVAALLCIGVLLGFAGWLHPAGDSLSLLRMPLGIACVIWALIRMRRALRLALLACGTAAALTTVPPLVAGQAGGTLTLYNKNLWYRNPELPALARDIIDSGAEVVTLQEVSRRNDPLLAMLQSDYPHQHICDFSGWSRIAVLSQHPIGPVACTSRRAMAAAQIRKDGQDIWVASVHLPWPHPYANDAASRAAVDVLERLDGPVVIGGDFNIFPWAASVARIRDASGTQGAGPVRPTFYLEGIPMFLDHVYAPGGGQVSYRPLLGSDHHGVLGQLNLFP